MIVRCLNPPDGILSGGKSAIPKPFKHYRSRTTFAASQSNLETSPELWNVTKPFIVGRNHFLTSVFPITYNQQRLVQLGSR